MSFAVMFPGQGSQSVGMLAELAAREPVVEQTFSEASEILGRDLWRLTQDGPEQELGLTENTQPAMLAAGVAVYRAWRSRGGPVPVAMAGHSLGEYTALVCAGRLEFRDTVSLVRHRGRLMQRAVPAGKGAMAAVLGLDDNQVASACEAGAHGQVVAPINYNCPGQVVIAGETAAVSRALEAATGLGARRAVMLDVSVPSHCALMDSAARELAESLREVRIDPGEVPVFHNVDARAHEDADQVRAVLIRQLSQPVRWSDCIRAMAGAGAGLFIEMGPGKVLTGLVRRIDRSLQAAACFDPDSLDTALNTDPEEKPR
jgi:[acyl-carrier-protein] S-malonyltransferase